MSKRLVAYFSASGVTAKVAENLADAIGADVFEIQPKVPYTKADLNWMDKKSRSTIEMSDPTSRPAIAAKRDNMDEYDTIFVGFPIWLYVAPTIINTFLESYNLKGKTIIPFATSGGSGMGKTNEKLAPSCPGAKLLHGKVFNSYSSKADLSAFRNENINPEKTTIYPSASPVGWANCRPKRTSGGAGRLTRCRLRFHLCAFSVDEALCFRLLSVGSLL